MKNFTIFLLCASLIFLSGFTSCEPQLRELLPPETDTPTSEVTSLSDPFENGALQNPNWNWQNEPPIWEINDNHLFIDAEPNRNLWATDATHLLYQEIDDDVFDVETKFTVRWDTSSGVTGIIVKSPADDNWVTLKFWARGSGRKGYIQFQKKQSSMGPLDAKWRFGDWGEIDLSFRLKKEGDTYTAWYKAAGDTDWMDIGTADFQLTPPLYLGIYAGVAAGGGNLQTEFEYFRDNLN